MKKFAKILLCILLITVSCAALLVGCQTTEDKLKNSPLIGAWVIEDDDSVNYMIIEYDSEYTFGARTDVLKRTMYRAEGKQNLRARNTMGIDLDGHLGFTSDGMKYNYTYKVSGDTLTVTGTLTQKSGYVQDLSSSIYTRTTLSLEEYEEYWLSKFETTD